MQIQGKRTTLKERDIRNHDALRKYLNLVEKDSGRYFDSKSFISVNCPACGSKKFTREFSKLGFRYVTCNNCFTLFANPRPRFRCMEKFYSDSESARFWINHFFKPVAEKRRAKIFRPRAMQISRLIGKRKGLLIGDIGAGFGLFLEELKRLNPDNRYIAIEPSQEMAEICRRKNIETQCEYLENLSVFKKKYDILTAFELLEHLFDPAEFLKKAHSLLKPGGMLILTTMNGNGFDIMLLWEKSKSISPPHHINFFNVNSAGLLIKKSRFKVIDISTPGRLDWDIVDGMIKNEKLRVGRLWDYLAHKKSEKCKEELQSWISRNKLSSHMQILAQK